MVAAPKIERAHTLIRSTPRRAAQGYLYVEAQLSNTLTEPPRSVRGRNDEMSSGFIQIGLLERNLMA